MVAAVAAHAAPAGSIEAARVAALAGERAVHAGEGRRMAEVRGPRVLVVTAATRPAVGMRRLVASLAVGLGMVEGRRHEVGRQVALGAQRRLAVVVVVVLVAVDAAAAVLVRRGVARLAGRALLLARVAAEAEGHRPRVDVGLAGRGPVYHLQVAVDAIGDAGVALVREGDRADRAQADRVSAFARGMAVAGPAGGVGNVLGDRDGPFTWPATCT